MASMSELRTRASELNLLPKMTPRRLYKILEREFVDAERDQLSIVSRVEGHPTGVHPWWTEHGQSLRPAQIRFQAKPKGGSNAAGTRRTTPKRTEASSVLPPVSVDDRRRETVPAPRWPPLDEEVAVLSEGDFSWGDDGGRGAEEGEDMSEFPTITIPATEIDENDYIEGEGVVLMVQRLKEYVGVFFVSLDSKLYLSDQKVTVRLEDDGEEVP